MKKFLIILALAVVGLMHTRPAQASQPALGIHLLDPDELSQAVDLIAGKPEHPGSVTVVLRADDRKKEKWQHFLDLTKENNVIPIIRLATEMAPDGWRRPTRKDVIDHASFLSGLDWPGDSLLVVAFNEPNHAAEWGGTIDPEHYAHVLEFSVNWFHTEAKQYKVLPAGLDAAAPDGPATMDSFTFIRRMLAPKPQLTEEIDGWVSHAYPNPGFTASPYLSGKSSINGFVDETRLLSQFTERVFDIYITETGWKKTPQNAEKLGRYLTYALDEVWNDARIKAVTPFVFAAHTGPFQDFSFTNQDGSPTPQYNTWKSLKEMRLEEPTHFLAFQKQE